MPTIRGRLRQLPVRAFACALPVLALAACGGSSGGDQEGGGNTSPTAFAGADQSVLESTAVSLNGSGSDPDTGDTLAFTWTQTGGVTVTLGNANSASTSFMAPDVALGVPEILTFQLSVSDGTVSRSDTVSITVQEPQPTVTVSGIVSYEFVPPLPTCRDLDFSAIETRPIRGATVQLIDAGNGNVLQTTTASATGDYVFANVNANSMVSIRVRAELKRTGLPRWDIEVRDNFLPGQSDFDFPAPPPEGTRALYVLDGANFNTGSVDIDRPVTARTGWGGSSYTGVRAAGPFAILDAFYSGIQLVLTADANAVFAPMDAFWSVNNTLGGGLDVTAGLLPTSFYNSGADSLYLLGDANVDTEEFDDHVVMHEWGHYFEDNFSRSDSVGGPHALGQSLDARLAFGEGWATAFAAMALDDPIYCDTAAIGSNGGFPLNTESGGFGVQGWFNEISVATLVYDLFDTDVDGTDTGSIGFGPIFDTMVGPQRVTPAWTTVHSFAAELRPMLNANDQALLDSQLVRERVNEPDPASVDIWASMENNDANGVIGSAEVLPLYTDYAPGDPVLNICVNNKFDTGIGGNKLAEFRYLRLTVPATDTYNVTIATTTTTPVTPDPNDRDQSDPDITIYLDGVQVLPFGVGLSGVENLETFTTPTLFAGDTYVADLHEWRYEDVDGAPANYPDRICFDYSMVATP